MSAHILTYKECAERLALHLRVFAALAGFKQLSDIATILGIPLTYWKVISSGSGIVYARKTVYHELLAFTNLPAANPNVVIERLQGDPSGAAKTRHIAISDLAYEEWAKTARAEEIRKMRPPLIDISTVFAQTEPELLSLGQIMDIQMTGLQRMTADVITRELVAIVHNLLGQHHAGMLAKVDMMKGQLAELHQLVTLEGNVSIRWVGNLIDRLTLELLDFETPEQRRTERFHEFMRIHEPRLRRLTQTLLAIARDTNGTRSSKSD